MQPFGSVVRRRMKRVALRLESQLADDSPLLCGCEETGATVWSADCSS